MPPARGRQTQTSTSKQSEKDPLQERGAAHTQQRNVGGPEARPGRPTRMPTPDRTRNTRRKEPWNPQGRLSAQPQRAPRRVRGKAGDEAEEGRKQRNKDSSCCWCLLLLLPLLLLKHLLLLLLLLLMMLLMLLLSEQSPGSSTTVHVPEMLSLPAKPPGPATLVAEELDENKPKFPPVLDES